MGRAGIKATAKEAGRKRMITPVLMCGGSGTRLWPLSRQTYPKQFAPIFGEESLFQAAARRVAAEGFGRPLVVTGEDFRFIVAEQMAALRLDPMALVIEPEGRNTAPAAAVAAAMVAKKLGQEALLLLAPADHLIPDAAAFRAAVAAGAAVARAGRIVTFGIAPERAETGYGWLATGAEIAPDVLALDGFIEKPDTARAAALFADPGYLWNAGVFLARADVLLEAFRAHAPEVLAAAEAALDAAEPDLGFCRLEKAAWAQAPAISIDYAVMEKAANLAAVRFAGHWSDLGSWTSIWQESPRDAAGNATHGAAQALDCEGSLLRSEVEGIELVGVGLRNVVAVAMPDAVLVADLTCTQGVKRAVEVLKAKGAKQATAFQRDHRPWGWFETLALGERFQVKRIVVKPGAALSLQSHVHRAEHWIVVQGTARVTVGEEVKLVSENQSVYIPLGAKHRMENPGKLPMVLIEVQTGSYLGEDDIIRYEDIYARKTPGE